MVPSDIKIGLFVSSRYHDTGYAAIKRLEGVFIELMVYRVAYVTGYLEVHALYSD